VPTCERCGRALQPLGATYGAEGTRVMTAEVFRCTTPGCFDPQRPVEVVLLDGKGRVLTGIDFVDPAKRE
jgi:hypothetical protein